MDFVANFISYAFQQCKKFENRLRFDKVTESLKMGTFLIHSIHDDDDDDDDDEYCNWFCRGLSYTSYPQPFRIQAFRTLGISNLNPIPDPTPNLNPNSNTNI